MIGLQVVREAAAMRVGSRVERYSKTGTVLPIRFIFLSQILKKAAVSAARARVAHASKFSFSKNHGDLKK